jgi:hypothetical protein
MSRHQPDPATAATEHAPADMNLILNIINDANRIFGQRHNWLSPLTSDEEHKQFIARCCDWWNHLVCPTMARMGAVWDERKQRFESAASRQSSENSCVSG